MSHTLLMLLIMILGITMGTMIRVEHIIKPIHPLIRFTWVAVSLFGIYFTSIIELFFFMNMVIIGWFVENLMV